MSKVLIGYSRCKLTQAAFEAHGHDVWTCDLLPAKGKHLQMDIWDAIAMGGWDFGIFHPMCTYLTVSAAWAFKDPDFIKYPGVGYHQRIKPGTLTGAARRAQREIELENFRRLDALPFANVKENPGKSFINTAIRPPDQIIHPHFFGDDASKDTGLWLSGGAPKLNIPEFGVAPRIVCQDCKHTMIGNRGCCDKCDSRRIRPRWSNQTDSGQNNLTPSDDRWLNRSATYPGIAAALGDQYGRWLNERTTTPDAK